MKAMATLEEVKDELQLTGAEYDDALTAALLAATRQAEQLVGRPLLREVDRLEYPQPAHAGALLLRLGLTPIESISAVRVSWLNATPEEFEEVIPLQEEAHFVVTPEAAAGLLERIDGYGWPKGARRVQAIYTAGYLAPEDEDAPGSEDAIAVPQDLRRAIVQQVIAWHNQRGKAGLESVDVGKGGGARFSGGELLPELVQVCQSLRRLM